MAPVDSGPSNFIRDIIAQDVTTKKHDGRVHTRFPPEPNGYLHIGHAKSICLNFGIAKDYAGGICNLRFDDTNPTKEDVEYTDSIKADVRWLGFDWDDREYYASDYFEQLYQFAIKLIEKGKAYVCDLSVEQIREYLNVDSLEYLTMDDLRSSVDDPDNFCYACFNGEYKVPLTTALRKTVFEDTMVES